MNIREATTAYESWLANTGTLDEADLDYKHALMSDAQDSFPFFRGTYYRWAQHWPTVCAKLANAPSLLAVGDLHLANFGTWRDGDGRLCWGVNDFDEADQLPCVHDLVRLAASVLFAKKSGGLEIKFKLACAAILEGYRVALEANGDPFVLEERHPELRAMAMSSDRDPVLFWKKLTKVLATPSVDPPATARAALLGDLPVEHLKPEFRLRSKIGVGSLGKQRYVVLAEWAGGWIAREAKIVAPPATAWAGNTTNPSRMAEIVASAKRAADPFYRPGPQWVTRRLAPRCSRIELDSLSLISDVEILLGSMGAETANVHLGSSVAPDTLLEYLTSLPSGWLPEAAKAMAEVMETDWAEWRSMAVRK